MGQENKNTTEEIEILKAALETLLRQRNYNFLDPLVQYLSRKIDSLINKLIEEQSNCTEPKD
ncbi:MAG TPA: Spo0E family sporulation regulatory protein-aspartic acid phosphatase [Defluviitaleaceae bacterium]|nr:Spo0E family sporulation regulatory protein-aspartic acid phosphatase [Candidatus Epulonipiscium sp.]HOQ17117.1 Spo0E family sporulation regulatory protein-aspartic acid phosphatase [Defluviitaleaceae bacterium]HPT76117.1 Spo0E family sporulation regulatory protein-aspartic acid phosphatase [Defluviitaleaceae bacterium]HQD49925.1 Spo0E family sporulation regulatory protein-aspartic acid phosphatase [Defluviitaleaceae bacterium]